jgi:hypothetical protein
MSAVQNDSSARRNLHLLLFAITPGAGIVGALWLGVPWCFRLMGRPAPSTASPAYAVKEAR